jgi:DNA-binding NtrC family response regulator
MSDTPTVLVVDDEEAFCRSILKILRVSKIQAEAVFNGEAALEAIAGHAYDVVLLDVKMPGISGIEVLKHIKEQGSFAEVIVLSGHASIDTASAIVAHGAYDYLLKPCGIDTLLAKISSAYECKLEKEKYRRPPKPAKH